MYAIIAKAVGAPAFYLFTTSHCRTSLLETNKDKNMKIAILAACASMLVLNVNALAMSISRCGT